MLRGDSMFLEVVSLPPTSLKAIAAVLPEAHHAGHPVPPRIVRIDLEKAQNQQGKPYGKAAMKFVRKLSPDEAARATEFRDLALSISGRVVPGMAAE